MTKLILSTSNIMGDGPSVVRRGAVQKSNAELTKALRAHFQFAQQQSAVSSIPDSAATTTTSMTNGANSSEAPKIPPLKSWTSRSDDGNTLYVPSAALSYSPLTEERSAYDITLKLFYLSGEADPSGREAQTLEAVNLVLKQLGVQSVDLLITSFPGISFDADDEDEDEQDQDDGEPVVVNGHDETLQNGTAQDSDSDASRTMNDCADDSIGPEKMTDMLTAWRALESLHDKGIISSLGLAEFGTRRLSRFLRSVRVRPRVDQINVRDCCVVPKPLILYAKQEHIELLTHSDCTNILPADTLRELLKPVGIVGEVKPLWVVKYTAVLKDQGVVENKGYFAVAELQEGT